MSGGGSFGSGSGRLMVLVTFRAIEMIVEQGPTVLAVGTGSGCSRLSYLVSFSLPLGDGQI